MHNFFDRVMSCMCIQCSKNVYKAIFALHCLCIIFFSFISFLRVIIHFVFCQYISSFAIIQKHSTPIENQPGAYGEKMVAMLNTLCIMKWKLKWTGLFAV